MVTEVKGAPLSGGLPAVPTGIGAADPEIQKQYSESIDKVLAALENRGGTNWAKIAAAMANPGRTGNWSEGFANAMNVVGQQREEDEARALPIAQMRASLVGQKYQMEQEAKDRNILTNIAGNAPLGDVAQVLSNPLGVLSNPGLYGSLQRAQMQMKPGTQSYQQVKDLLDTAAKSIDFGIKQGQLNNDNMRTFFESAKLKDLIPNLNIPSMPSGQPIAGAPSATPNAAPASAPSASVANTVEIPSIFGPKIKAAVTTVFKDGHYGVDWAVPGGTPMAAPADSMVVATGSDPRSGNYVTFKTPDGYTHTAAHLSDILVKKDQEVPMGTTFGTVGATGNATGNHVHWITKDPEGKPIDPLKYFGVTREPTPAQPSVAAAGVQTSATPEVIPPKLAEEIARIKGLGLGGAEERAAIKEASAKFTAKTTEESQSLTTHEREVLRQGNKEFFESTQKPLTEAVRTGNQSYVANQRALKVLDSTKVGPGTTLGMELSKIKDFVIGLTPEEMNLFVKQKSINQAQAESVAAGVKAAFGGNLSNKETDRFIQSLYSINDPKEFIRAALEMQIYAHKLNQDLLSNLTNVDQTKTDKNKVFTNYWSSDKPTELLKKYAPSVAKIVATSPTLEVFLKEARAKNPGVSDAQLTDYYNQNYGK
jgi:murein DD-endopeptidase MepM/ murein hydrolase activator NlpD